MRKEGKSIARLSILLGAVLLCSSFVHQTSLLPSGENKIDLLCLSTWYVIALDSSQKLLPCNADNFLRFTNNHSMVFDEGSIKCDYRDSQCMRRLWTFSADENYLTIITNGDSSHLLIEELSDTALILSQVLFEDIKVSMRYKH